MASVSDIIATQDADAIKRKRTSTQAMITVVRNSLEKILVKKISCSVTLRNMTCEFFIVAE